MYGGQTDGSLHIHSDLLHEPGSHVVLGHCVCGALWGVVLVGVALAFMIEWRVTGREGHSRA